MHVARAFIDAAMPLWRARALQLAFIVLSGLWVPIWVWLLYALPAVPLPWPGGALPGAIVLTVCVLAPCTLWGYTRSSAEGGLATDTGFRVANRLLVWRKRAAGKGQ